jgi:hypothetical protein
VYPFDTDVKPIETKEDARRLYNLHPSTDLYDIFGSGSVFLKGE